MFNVGNSELQARSDYLLNAQDAVESSLFSLPFIKEVGIKAVEEMDKLNQSLFIPNHANGTIKIPPNRVNTEAVPFLALSPNEQYEMAPMLGALTFGQQANVGTAASNMVASPKAQQELAQSMCDLHSKAKPQKISCNKDDKSSVIASTVDLEMTPSAVTTITGRPLIITQYKPEKAVHSDLFYAEIFAAHALLNPVARRYASKGMQQESDAKLHLRAHHMVATYAESIQGNKNIAKISHGEIAPHAAIEHNRKMYTTDDCPYELNINLKFALRRLGVNWL